MSSPPSILPTSISEGSAPGLGYRLEGELGVVGGLLDGGLLDN